MVLFYYYFRFIFKKSEKIVKNSKNNKIWCSIIFQYVDCVEQIRSTIRSSVHEIWEREVKTLLLHVAWMRPYTASKFQTLS
jgi:hypothetical protein